MEEMENLGWILVKNLRERDYLEDPVMDDRISSAQMFQKARSRLQTPSRIQTPSRLQTPDFRSKTLTQGVQTLGTAENIGWPG